MKKNDFNEIKALDIPALSERVTKLKKEISNQIMDKHMGQLKDLITVNKGRKDLARLLTVLRQKEMLVVTEEKGDK